MCPQPPLSPPTSPPAAPPSTNVVARSSAPPPPPPGLRGGAAANDIYDNSVRALTKCTHIHTLASTTPSPSSPASVLIMSINMNDIAYLQNQLSVINEHLQKRPSLSHPAKSAIHADFLIIDQALNSIPLPPSLLQSVSTTSTISSASNEDPNKNKASLIPNSSKRKRILIFNFFKLKNNRNRSKKLIREACERARLCAARLDMFGYSQASTAEIEHIENAEPENNQQQDQPSPSAQPPPANPNPQKEKQNNDDNIDDIQADEQVEEEKPLWHFHQQRILGINRTSSLGRMSKRFTFKKGYRQVSDHAKKSFMNISSSNTINEHDQLKENVKFPRVSTWHEKDKDHRDSISQEENKFSKRIFINERNINNVSSSQQHPKQPQKRVSLQQQLQKQISVESTQSPNASSPQNHKKKKRRPKTFHDINHQVKGLEPSQSQSQSQTKEERNAESQKPQPQEQKSPAPPPPHLQIQKSISIPSASSSMSPVTPTKEGGGGGAEGDDAAPESSKPKERNMWRAASMYKIAADKGDARAMCDLATCYQNGVGVNQDKKYAVELFRRAADMKLARGQFSLARCYAFGEGIKRDVIKAVELYKLASDNGHAAAMCNLGVCYQKGVGVQMDYAKAISLYKHSGTKGYARAWYNLGVCYESGTGVTTDINKAVALYKKSARGGFASAMCTLGACYESGTGVDSDVERAVVWYKRAARGGCVRANFFLGLCYERGSGVGERDVSEAVRLFKKAANAGLQDAAVYLKAMTLQ